MALEPKHWISLEEYHEIERTSEIKEESPTCLQCRPQTSPTELAARRDRVCPFDSNK
jgi:hypothetical protein